MFYRQRHKIRDGETLFTALRYVELSPQADLAGCYIVRMQEKIFIDVDDLLSDFRPEKDIELKPLDTVVIPYVR